MEREMEQDKKKEREKDEFWDQYVQPYIPDIISGKTWPYFTHRSISCLKKLGFVIEHKGNLCIGHRNEVFVVDNDGNCIELSYKGTIYRTKLVKIDISLSK